MWRRALLTGSRRYLNVYKPGDVVRLKNRRWKKRVDGQLAGAEAQTAWQASVAVTLGVVFVGLPWAYCASLDATNIRAGSGAKKEALQQTVYDKRLDRRRGLEEEQARSEGS